MNLRTLFSSKNNDWETPDWLFDQLNREFNFTLDVCATPENAKCALYFTPEQNALIQDWTPNVCFMNPPCGRDIGKWVKKAYAESTRGATVVCLLPARTDTSWWHDVVMLGAAEIRFIRGRVRFKGGKWSAPFPSAIVVFRPGVHQLRVTPYWREVHHDCTAPCLDATGYISATG